MATQGSYGALNKAEHEAAEQPDLDLVRPTRSPSSRAGAAVLFLGAASLGVVLYIRSGEGQDGMTSAGTAFASKGPTDSSNPKMSPSGVAVPFKVSKHADFDSLYGLQCDKFDDDGIYPSDGCNKGDTYTCIKEIAQSANYWDACGTYCDTSMMAKMEELNDDEDLLEAASSNYPNSSWAVVCGWEAVRSMPAYCNGTFTASMPAGSNNFEPSYERVGASGSTGPSYEAIDGQNYTMCNVHGFCSGCLESDQVTVNKHCQAMTTYYGTKSIYRLSTFFDNAQNFWCQDDVLASIEAGTFGLDYAGWSDDGYYDWDGWSNSDRR